MANRFPLVFDAQTSGTMKELPSGDNLNLAGSSIIDAVNITATGTLTVPTLNVTTLNIQGAGGGSIAPVAISNDYNDLTNLPVLFSGSYNDLQDLPTGVDWATVTNAPTIPTKLSELENDTNFANEQSLNIAASQITGLGAVAVSNSFTDLVDANEIVTQSQLVGDTLTVEVTNTGDLVGSVFGADSTLLVDHLNNKILADLSTNVITTPGGDLDITTGGVDLIENINIDVNGVGNITLDGDEIFLKGRVTADRLYGTFTGFVYSNDSTLVVNPDTGDLNGIFNGDVNGDIDKRTQGSILAVKSLAGIEFTPNGIFNVPNATNVTLNATNEMTLSSTGDLKLESSSGNVKFELGTTVDFGGSIVDFNNASVSGLDVQLTGDLTGSVFADNSTILVDAVSGSIPAENLTGVMPALDASGMLFAGISNPVSITSSLAVDNINIQGNIISSTTGDITLQANSGNVIAQTITTANNDSLVLTTTTGTRSITINNLGNIDVIGQLTSTENNHILRYYYADQVSFPDPTTYHGAIAHSHADGAMYFAHGGQWVALANEDGVVRSGTTANINITGNVDGDVNGSIFADDSSLLVDAVNGTIPGYISLATLKTEVAASADFADFQSRIAAL